MKWCGTERKTEMAVCDVCFRHCGIPEGKNGACGVRGCREGKVVSLSYGAVSSLALDPIEKKPLARFHPGAMILSAGSAGCNLFCPFCQNHELSGPANMERVLGQAARTAPEELVRLAASCRTQGNIGLAFTYNEPLVGYEFVRDTAKLLKEEGMAAVMVTNGTAELPVLEELLPYIDAMNIDLKGFTDSYYRDFLKGDRRQVMEFISRAAGDCHVEITTLIVPGMNDSEEEIRELSGWIASLGEDIPLHLTRYFPRHRMTEPPAASPEKMLRLAEIAGKQLRHVYTGNM